MKALLPAIIFALFCSSAAVAQTLVEESFEGAAFPPDGWTETMVEVAGYGTDPDWYRNEGTDLSPYNSSYLAPAYDGSFLAEPLGATAMSP